MLIVTYAGVAELSYTVTEVAPQIEVAVDEPYYLFIESFKKGYDTDLELPR